MFVHTTGYRMTRVSLKNQRRIIGTVINNLNIYQKWQKTKTKESSPLWMLS